MSKESVSIQAQRDAIALLRSDMSGGVAMLKDMTQDEIMELTVIFMGLVKFAVENQAHLNLDEWCVKILCTLDAQEAAG